MTIKNIDKSYLVPGICLLFVSVGFLLGSSMLSVGSLSQMGPGYFPLMLSIMLLVMSLGMIVIAFRDTSSDIQESTDIKGIIIVICSVAMFSLLLEQWGLAISTFVCCLISSAATSNISLSKQIVISLVITIVSLLIFGTGLDLQVNLWPGVRS